MVRVCEVCGCKTDTEWGESKMRGHPHCIRCGLLFGDGHIAREDELGLCQFCAEELVEEEIEGELECG